MADNETYIKGFSIQGVTRKIDYDELANQPTIPTTVAELSDGSEYIKSAATVAAIEAAVAKASAYTDSKVTGLSETYAAKSYESTVDTLVGSDTGKSARQISIEEVAKIVASADSAYDTLKEIADWILNDKTGAAKMVKDIAELKVSAHTHDNLTVLEGISSEDVNSWDAKQTALSDNDGGYGQRVKAIEDTLAAAINFEAQKY